MLFHSFQNLRTSPFMEVKYPSSKGRNERVFAEKVPRGSDLSTSVPTKQISMITQRNLDKCDTRKKGIRKPTSRIEPI